MGRYRYNIALPKTALDLNLKTLKEGWWTWWNNINPSWRTQSSSSYAMEKEDGDWEECGYNGDRGIVMVLIALWWWRALIENNEEEELESWNYAFNDVAWVLCQLTEFAK